MTETSTAGLCHLTVRTPDTSIDWAVPSDVPVSDLLPAVLRHAGAELEEEGLEHGGWVLQRLGEAPLEGEGTLGSLNVKHGEVLYLRPRTEELPAVRLDDLVDGIATTMRDHLHSWGPYSSRLLLRGLTGFTVAIGLLILVWPGGSPAARVLSLAATGALLLAGAATASRAVGDAPSGAVLGVFAAPCLALAGWLVPGGELAGAYAQEVLGARLLAAGAAGAGGAVLAVSMVALYTPLFTGVTLCALAGMAGGALMAFAGFPIEEAALMIAATCAALGAFIPSIAFKLAGMRMPFLPNNPQQLQEDIEPYSGRAVSARTKLANSWMTVLYASTGVVAAVCVLPVLSRPALPEVVTTGVLSMLLLLHGRGLGNVWQRLSMALPGVWGLTLLTLALVAAVRPEQRPAVAGATFAVAAVLAIASWVLPGRRLVPYWGRAAELLHSALAISLLPLVLWVVGLFGGLRGLNG
ncbi:type VII secretion integral membrane protein EccD [Streptomyces xantholiticus]|uniref:type VII secretion integral membrane protein EccD n=1 Tax=Streptomyces xantholiticus TaxID=68285 RepID=UPI001672D996|nr:type VII secretion integral membrane protein EccD [Streptomyces xantholiticus]GGW30833.1 hypothetical protein GCM10010381_14150 [Streptomyces xantholiticus]